MFFGTSVSGVSSCEDMTSVNLDSWPFPWHIPPRTKLIPSTAGVSVDRTAANSQVFVKPGAKWSAVKLCCSTHFFKFWMWYFFCWVACVKILSSRDFCMFSANPAAISGTLLSLRFCSRDFVGRGILFLWCTAKDVDVYLGLPMGVQLRLSGKGPRPGPGYSGRFATTARTGVAPINHTCPTCPYGLLCWANLRCVGLCWVHVQPWAHVGPMSGLCWDMLGHVEPKLATWPTFGPVEKWKNSGF